MRSKFLLALCFFSLGAFSWEYEYTGCIFGEDIFFNGVKIDAIEAYGEAAYEISKNDLEYESISDQLNINFSPFGRIFKIPTVYVVFFHENQHGKYERVYSTENLHLVAYAHISGINDVDKFIIKKPGIFHGKLFEITFDSFVSKSDDFDFGTVYSACYLRIP